MSQLFPLQADLPPGKTQLMYFRSESEQKNALWVLLAQQGFSSQLEQYLPICQIGRGGYSEVWLVKHRKTQERLAMKIIPAETFSKNYHLFTNEIELHSRCKGCPSIVHFKEYFIAEDRHCLVMEHLEAGDLHQSL